MTEIPLLLGADPELFIRNKKTNSFVSAHDLIPGSKVKPYKLNNQVSVQVDGTAAEFNISPAKNVSTFIQSVNSAKKGLKRLLRQKGKDYQLMITSSVQYDAVYYSSLPRYVKIIGCDLDYDAYSLQERIPEEDQQLLPEGLVVGGGHLHFGYIDQDRYVQEPYPNVHLEDCARLSRQLDASLWFLSYLWDYDSKRRQTYGEKGRFRPKPYGCEYRSLSNAWIRNKELMSWIFKASNHAFQILHQRIYLNDPKINKMVDFVHNNDPKFSQLKAYHNMLTDIFLFPKLPDIFLTEKHFETMTS